jgi:hypothetical protein
VGLTRGLVLAGTVLYVASLLLPAVDGPGFPAQSGRDMLAQGAGAWRDGVVAWYANPMLAIAIVLNWIGRCRLGLAAAVLALALALSSYSAAAVAGLAGRSVPAFSFGPGFYLWLAAMVVIAASAVAGMYAAAGIYKVSRGDGGPETR